ncbi:hypothetical protein DTO021C3_6991 [Paecilomyces variotii]|nr:hypothetical protein DTO195F2_1374 [Paecilomyces variotii]KAJ9285467.1 hypothetical protein DTO021C3_6991 [Paecilomyces variotii]KAJ9307463.1 hypothetical protein DTO217A2_2935 [Paecilomyces variotii]
MTTLEKLRPVGPLERYSTARHHLGFYNNVALTARHLVPYDDESSLKDRIYGACATVINDYPMLSAVPVDEGSREPYFARLPKITLDRTVSFYSRKIHLTNDDDEDAELDSLLETQHNTSFKTDPGSEMSTAWRLVVILDSEDRSAFDVAFIFHHALGDGMSGLIFHRAFSEALVSFNGTPPTEVISPSREISPALESALYITISPLYLLKEVFWSSIGWQERGLWVANPTGTTPKSRYRSMRFSKDTTARLLSICRENETTVSALLQVQIARTLFSILPSTYGKLLCNGAATARRWMDVNAVDDNTIGCYVAAYSDTYIRNALQTDDFPWHIARQSRENILKLIDTKGKDNPIGLLRFIPDVNKMLLSKIGKPRTNSFSVSNVGLFNPKKSAEPAATTSNAGPRVGKMLFSQSGNHFGTPFEACVVTGGDGCLTIGFAWADAAFSEELLLQLMHGVKDGLEGLVSP